MGPPLSLTWNWPSTTSAAERYDRTLARYPGDDAAQAKTLLRLHLQQNGGKLVLFFDNLESLQDPADQTLRDKRLAAWIEAARSLTGQGLILLLTSRWRLPGWPAEDHWPLTRPSYGDFLQMAQRQPLPASFYRDWGRLRRVYQALNGNGRGLTFFAAAIQDLAAADETSFLARLAQAEAEVQTDMALALIIDHLDEASYGLLQRLPAYQTPVPREGLLRLGLDLAPDPAPLLERLLAVSLVEAQAAPHWQTTDYQISPLVSDWLREQGLPEPGLDLRQSAAAYQRYLYQHERPTLTQAMATHQALRRAEETAEADRLALDVIVTSLNRAGLYRTLLTDWLPPICQSPDPHTRAAALNQTGKQHLHLGDYEEALGYLEQSLVIVQEIGEKAGEGRTLNNMATAAHARGTTRRRWALWSNRWSLCRKSGTKQGKEPPSIISRRYSKRGEITRWRWVIWSKRWSSCRKSGMWRGCAPRCSTWGISICKMKISPMRCTPG